MSGEWTLNRGQKEIIIGRGEVVEIVGMHKIKSMA